MSQTCQNKLKPKRDWCNKPTKLQFQTILSRKILMLSNATNQPKSTVELGYMWPSGTHWSNSSDTHQVVEIQKENLPRCIHHFKSDLINNMDHMRISGNEPSSVVLSQRSNFKKLKKDVPNVPKQAEANSLVTDRESRFGNHQKICAWNLT